VSLALLEAPPEVDEDEADDGSEASEGGGDTNAALGQLAPQLPSIGSKGKGNKKSMLLGIGLLVVLAILPVVALGGMMLLALLTPISGNGSSAGSCWAAGSGTVDTNTVFGYLVADMGFTEQQAAAVIGNFVAESGLNPRVLQPSTEIPAGTSNAAARAMAQGSCGTGRCGVGLAQWTSPGRQDGLFDLADATGRPWDDLGLQLEFFASEVNSTYGRLAANRGFYDAGKSLSDLTQIWGRAYESPSEAHANWPLRIAAAQSALNGLGSGGEQVPVSGCVPGGIQSGPIGQSLAELPKQSVTNLSPSSFSGLQPTTRAFAEAINARFAGTTITSLYREGDPQDHGKGLAIDAAVPVGGGLGHEINAWVMQAHREGVVQVCYTIWEQTLYKAPGFAGQRMADRGSVSANHHNHVHISLVVPGVRGTTCA